MKRCGAQLNRFVTLPRKKFTIVGWTKELPQLLASHHVLVSKAGGATVQEAIAGRVSDDHQSSRSRPGGGKRSTHYPNHSGTVALNNDEVIATLTRAFADGGKLLHEWSANIAKISRPAASLDIAKFLVSL